MKRGSVFTEYGRSFVIQQGVFSPLRFPSSKIFTDSLLKLVRPGSHVLEIGCGAGITSIILAGDLGCRVVASDLNPLAVQNADLNVAKHCLGHRVDVRFGSLFQAVGSDEKFTAIAWNSAFMYVDEGNGADADRTFYDPGYLDHAQYLKDCRRFLAHGGIAYLGFSTIGDRSRLEKLAAEARVNLRSETETDFVEDGIRGTYWLLSIHGMLPYE